MHRRVGFALAFSALLSACGSAIPRPDSASRPPAPVPASRPAAPVRPPPEAQVLRVRGLESVIGANARSLVSQFGQPRLDVTEGDARKLQFSGQACVLDIYLYPTRSGAEPSATYVDARRGSDGLDVDRAACVAALRQR